MRLVLFVCFATFYCFPEVTGHPVPQTFDQLREMYEKLKEKVQDAMDQAQEMVTRAYETARTAVERGLQSAQQAIKEGMEGAIGIPGELDTTDPSDPSTEDNLAVIDI